ncbi:hypothetical protein NLJ89_g9569 [Agrocybe chaxingu]|uniref:Uncharacterized protein n=1 Tax=Agrocybe chaxingu TaxID=84603 RepID=A0A9W8JZR6_9AGAR|nr:hypothetical protein NLJ89_g9569 [Agrocybe chaxingu]
MSSSPPHTLSVTPQNVALIRAIMTAVQALASLSSVILEETPNNYQYCGNCHRQSSARTAQTPHQRRTWSADGSYSNCSGRSSPSPVGRHRDPEWATVVPRNSHADSRERGEEEDFETSSLRDRGRLPDEKQWGRV